MGLSNLGIFHTLIGVITIVAAIVSYIKFNKINLAGFSGKIYFYGTIITSLTALGISKRGGFNPGHVFSILILILVLVAWFLYSGKKGNNPSRYFENFCLTFSFFLSWLPTVNETFTRIPIGHPLAKDITDPIIGKTLLVLFLLFVVGSVFQYYKQKNINLAARL
jgi:cbb3-type cytochrome oxidase subunit 3